MAAFLAPNEPCAILTCCRMAVRNSRASFLRSASTSGPNGPRQRCLIAAVIASILKSVEEGTDVFYGMLILRFDTVHTREKPHEPEFCTPRWSFSTGRRFVQYLRTAPHRPISGGVLNLSLRVAWQRSMRLARL